MSHVALATHALWHAAGRPNHPDFEPAGGRCWWCASPVDGSGWPVRLLPDTFPTPMLARAKSSTHLCAPCGWTLASGFTLPPELAADVAARAHEVLRAGESLCDIVDVALRAEIDRRASEP